jgi:membrane protein implicated in regulation of membrane protease activity
MTWWIWLLLGFFLMLLEMVTPGGFYLLFFGFGAIVVALLTALNVSGPLWLQWLLFSLLAVAVLPFRRPLLKRMRLAGTGVEVDSLVGQTAVALQEIAADAVGKAELRGTPWNARNASSAPVKEGQRCTVERVEGVMLWIRGQ